MQAGSQLVVTHTGRDAGDRQTRLTPRGGRGGQVTGGHAGQIAVEIIAFKQDIITHIQGNVQTRSHTHSRHTYTKARHTHCATHRSHRQRGQQLRGAKMCSSLPFYNCCSCTALVLVLVLVLLLYCTVPPSHRPSIHVSFVVATHKLSPHNGKVIEVIKFYTDI